MGVIHDLNFEHYPEDLPKNILKYYKKNMPLFAQKANKIITVSNYSKNDIVNKYKVNSEKIKVIYNGGNEIFKPLSEEKKKFQTNNSNLFYLYVGSLHKRKNIERMLKAFQAFNHR